VYQGDLGISLIDTYTTASYLHTLTLKQAKLLDGFRQDSGDEFKIGNMIIDKLREMRIDPTTKTIVFSNALNFEKYAEIARYFKGRIKVAAGIGTNLTCDLGIEGYKPANIVMKLSRCRYSPRDFWEFVIKISDDLGKHMGHEDLFEIAAKELHFKELGVAV
jgi:nicotinate phosphoribosyltransferase